VLDDQRLRNDICWSVFGAELVDQERAQLPG
jgi:hypothetical protein